MIEKFCYHRENYRHSENLAIAKISLWLRKFCYGCENFAIIGKISLWHSEIAQPSCILQPGLFLFQLDISSSRLDAITENSYELGKNQRNFDAKLDMMVEAYETCKTTKNNLETKSVILMDLHMSIGLINKISTQKALKTYLK